MSDPAPSASAPAVADPPAPPSAPSWTRWIGPGLALAILGFAVWALVRQLRGLDPDKVWTALRSLPPSALAGAAGLLVLCFVAYALMERLASRDVRDALGEPPAVDGAPRAVPPPFAPLRALLVALVAQGVSLSTGKGFFVAGAIRVRVLARWGWSTGQALGITMLVLLHGNVGLTALLAVVCAIGAPWTWGWWLAGGGAVGVVVWFLLCAAHEPLELRGWRAVPPRPLAALAGLAAGALEKLACGLLAWVLMPGDPGIGLAPFLAVMLLALGFARFSQVPGGLGVLEASVLGLWPVPEAERQTTIIIAGLLAFRVAYYLVPLFAALPVLAFLAWGRKPAPDQTPVQMKET